MNNRIRKHLNEMVRDCAGAEIGLCQQGCDSRLRCMRQERQVLFADLPLADRLDAARRLVEAI